MTIWFCVHVDTHLNTLIRYVTTQLYSGVLSKSFGYTSLNISRWRFVFTGAVDGFSRKIFCLELDDNNKAVTILWYFRKKISHPVFFVVSLTKTMYYLFTILFRTDKGKENIGIDLYMAMHRGANKSSAITGRSVHNTRIELLWLDFFRVIRILFTSCFSKYVLFKTRYSCY